MRLKGAWLGLSAALAGTVMLTVTVRGQSPQSPSAPAPTASSTVTPGYEGLVVSEISFPDVPTPADRENYARMVVQPVGQPLSRGLIRQTVQALYASGRFADIRAEAERTADGKVAVSFHTSPNYFIGDVSTEGNPAYPTAGQVANASKLNLGELFTPEKMDSAVDAIRQLMKQNGYFKAEVTDQETRHPETQQLEVVFHIKPGPRAHVGIVSVTGGETFSAEQIRDIAGIHPGDSVTAARTTSALERLRKRYQKQDRWLTQVRIASQVYNPGTNAVDYTFDVIPGPKVRIEADGFKFSRAQLKKLVPVFQENALDDDLLNEGRRNLLNYLQGRGYFEAKVEYQRRRRPNAQNELVVTYKIDAGDRHKMVGIQIAGNELFNTNELRQHMQMQVAERLLSRGRYSQKLLNDDIATIQNLYHSNGYRDVKVTPDVQDDYAGRKNEVDVKLTIAEGAQTHVGAFQIEGSDRVPQSDLPPLNTASGQAFSEARIAEDRDIILNYYFNRGFLNASFDASVRPDPVDSHLMNITFTIHEGEQFFVNQVLYSGLNFTRPFVATREVDIKPRDPLSQFGLFSTQQRLYDLGIFNQVDTAVQDPDGQEKAKNILINVKEARRYTFNYGLGLEFQTGQPTVGTNQAQGETGVSPRVSFGVTRLNFRGRDHTVSFKGNVGRLQQLALLGYEAPRWFNSPDWKLSLSLSYDKTVDVTTFTSERLESAFRAIQNLNKISTMEYRFTYRRVQATNLPTNTSLVLLPLLSQPARVGIPGFTYIRDKRDNALDPAKGNYTTADGGVASQYFGSQRDFSRLVIQNATYYAFGKNPQRERKFVFARSTRIGVETPFAGTVYIRPGLASTAATIPLPELLLAGGGNSHRGFGLNQAGPRDPDSGFPLGGSALFVNNLELRFPPLSLPFVQDNISLAIFEDAGNVFVSGHDMLHNLLRWRQQNPGLCLQDSTATQCDYSYVSHAIGVGVRYKTPIGPVRFDFGYNLNPPAFPSCQATADPNNPTPSARCTARDPGSPFFVPQHAHHFNVFFSIGQTF